MTTDGAKNHQGNPQAKEHFEVQDNRQKRNCSSKSLLKVSVFEEIFVIEEPNKSIQSVGPR